MNLIVIKTIFCLMLMIVLLIMAFITKDVVNSQLFASLGIVIGASVYKLVSTQNITSNEKN
jgi:hypothetical protein